MRLKVLAVCAAASLVIVLPVMVTLLTVFDPPVGREQMKIGLSVLSVSVLFSMVIRDGDVAIVARCRRIDIDFVSGGGRDAVAADRHVLIVASFT